MIRVSGIAESRSWVAHQLTQKCFVSRTAKGKGKLKDGQPLKRSKITKKKGPGDAAPADRGPRNEAKARLEQLENACLTAPTPVRFLTPKQRKREEEREKMGLISNARRVELEMQKKNKNKKGEFSSPWIIGTPGLDLITLGLVDAESIPKYELTVEDGRRLAKEYSRVLMRRHRARQAAESTILRLKKEAIEALPENLKAAALVPDLTPFPANRFMATLTPPIEGYMQKVMEAAKKSVTKTKLR